MFLPCSLAYTPESLLRPDDLFSGRRKLPSRVCKSLSPTTDTMKAYMMAGLFFLFLV